MHNDYIVSDSKLFWVVYNNYFYKNTFYILIIHFSSCIKYIFIKIIILIFHKCIILSILQNKVNFICVQLKITKPWRTFLKIAIPRNIRIQIACFYCISFVYGPYSFIKSLNKSNATSWTPSACIIITLAILKTWLAIIVEQLTILTVTFHAVFDFGIIFNRKLKNPNHYPRSKTHYHPIMIIQVKNQAIIILGHAALRYCTLDCVCAVVH